MCLTECKPVTVLFIKDNKMNNDNKKLITFVIPCYNSAGYMRKCIDSCLNAADEKGDVEIIVVDDGSTLDNTYEIALEYEKEHPDVVKAVHKENGGHGSAVNIGIKLARGTFLKVVDSDDWLDKPALKIVMDDLRSFKKKKPDIYITNFVYENQTKYHKKRVHFENVFPLRKFFKWDDIGVFLVDQYLLMHSVVYKTSILHKCGLVLPEKIFYVDNIFVFDPLPYVKTLYYNNVNFYRYFIGRDDQSIKEETMIRRIDQHIYIAKTMTQTLKNADIKSPKCEKYMMKYLTIMYQIASILLIVGGTPEHLEKKKLLWQYLKETDFKRYVRMRYHPFGIILNMPGEPARKFLIKAYHGLGKYIGFN